MPPCKFTAAAAADLYTTYGLPLDLTEVIASEAGYGVDLEGPETLVNVADAEKFENAKADRPVGPQGALQFRCGAQGEFAVNGWKSERTKK